MPYDILFFEIIIKNFEKGLEAIDICTRQQFNSIRCI